MLHLMEREKNCYKNNDQVWSKKLDQIIKHKL